MLKWLGLSVVAIVSTLPAAAQTDAPLPDGAGKEIVTKACVSCHKANVITSKHATPAQWANIVQQMVSRGADLTDDQIDIVTRYLSANFPAAAKADPPAPPPSSISRYLDAGAWSYTYVPGISAAK
jgi:mono/diheme cytochrome c family protein